MKQKLEPFLNALRPRQVKSYLKEEEVCRDKLGFSRLPNSTFESLKNHARATVIRDRGVTGVDLVWNQIRRQTLQQEGLGRQLSEAPIQSIRDHRLIGVHTYNVLANPYFYLKYMYIPYDIP